MLSLGWSKSNKKAFENLLFSSHQIDVRIQMLNLSGDYLYDISNLFLDGQCDFDEEAEVTASASLQFFDPGSKMDLDTNSPNKGAMFVDRMIRIVYCVGEPDDSKWYEVPLMVGPITKVDRTDDHIDVEIQGKEYLLYSSVPNSDTYKKGKKIVNVFRDIANDYGEKNAKISIRVTEKHAKKTLTKEFAIGKGSTPMSRLDALGRALGCDVYYDGRGVLHLAEKVFRRVFTIERFTTAPQIGYNVDNLINCVKVIGAKPKGKGKKKVQVTVRASRGHPLSPWSLGRNNKPRFYMAIIEDEKLKTKKDCKIVAKRRLKQGLAEAVEVSCDSVVVPHLQVNDVVQFQTETFTAHARVRKMSFSLGPSAAASYGYNRNLTPQKKKIRRHRK